MIGSAGVALTSFAGTISPGVTTPVTRPRFYAQPVDRGVGSNFAT